MCGHPLAAYIALIHFHNDIPTLPYTPLRCKTFSTVLNPFSRVHFNAKIWNCPFYYQRNHFLPHYSLIFDTNLLGKLYPQYATVQYSLSVDSTPHSLLAPVFVFVLDMCMIEEEMTYVKSALKQAIGLLPENALVGFISFGTQVQVHELGFAELSKVYVFKGSKEISKDQVLEQLDQ